MKSLKSQLYELVSRHYPNFMNGGEAERYAMDNGFKASNASRRLRELATEGKLWRRETENGSVEYLAREKRKEEISFPLKVEPLTSQSLFQ